MRQREQILWLKLEMSLTIHQCFDFDISLYVFGTHACNGQIAFSAKYPLVSCKIHFSNVLPIWLGDLSALKAHRTLSVYDKTVEMSRLITLV